jgi:hypothetical protein
MVVTVFERVSAACVEYEEKGLLLGPTKLPCEEMRND